jgi:phosphoglycerol transferase MdoB-like AlkP superfamily enzyme
MLSHGNEVLVDKNDFLDKDMNSKWGAFDGVVYQKQLADFKNTNQPFFSTILTLTNHEPFELPVKGKYPGTELANLFRSTAHYADSTLGAYLRDAAKQTWYKNTLFIIVADHGHRLPSEKYEKYHPMRYRIPLIFFGEVIKPEYRGSRIQKYGGQTDIAQTLFNQMGIDASRFKWSKDLLNPDSRDFAFYDYDNGFGWITPEQSLAFDNVGKQVVYREKNTGIAKESEMLKNGKAYLQTVFQEYLDY